MSVQNMMGGEVCLQENVVVLSGVRDCNSVGYACYLQEVNE